MKCPRTIPFLHPGLALGAKRHEGFAEAWNWLIHSFWHMTLGDGLKWENKWQGYPKINLKIEGGDGIDVKYGGGKVIISLGTGQTEDDDDSGGSGNGGGGNGNGGNGGGSGGGGGGDDGGTSCNEFSGDLENGDEDPGLGNDGDNCSVLNGW